MIGNMSYVLAFHTSKTDGAPSRKSRVRLSRLTGKTLVIKDVTQNNWKFRGGTNIRSMM